VRRSLYVLAAVAVLLVAGALAFLGVDRLRGSDVASPALSVPRVRGLDDARRFRDYPLYWLGETFEGLPLMAVQGVGGSGYSVDAVAFIYGDCTIPPGGESCPVPLDIDILPHCKVPPAIIAERAKRGQPFTLRGASAQWVGETLHVWTGPVVIRVSSTLGDSFTTEAAENLVRLNGGEPSSPAEDLGPPDNISCPPKPGLIP